jgi:hypothetical protein
MGAGIDARINRNQSRGEIVAKAFFDHTVGVAI